ncbi:MAG TPA: nickel pincer cofactor biosynthesis protein LarC [Thermoprotei archaeon]|nr:nickel pincer cofactor biosynthesis protein LarC [Thermoprotei archaeon]
MKIGSSKILYIDSTQAGIAGDMFLAAMSDIVDIDMKVLADAVCESTPWCKKLDVDAVDGFKNKFRCKEIKLALEEEHAHKRDGKDVINAVLKSGSKLSLSDKALEYAKKVVETLLWAESRIHGKSMDEVHLHEIGSTDTILDIAGVSYALDKLGVFKKDIKVYGSPVAVGGGYVEMRHGRVSVPAPATLEILSKYNYPFIGGPVYDELATPTGVALLVNIVEKVLRYPPLIKPLKVGYGGGMKEFKSVPNIIRIVYGEDDEIPFLHDKVYVLETNIDDLDDETIGYTLEKLYNEGARDVSIIPVTTKKSRPGKIIKVLCDEDNYINLVKILFDETGTLGVRVYPVNRIILKREIIPYNVVLSGKQYKVNIKVAKDNLGRVIRVKPEYSDLVYISKKLKKPLRIVREIIYEDVRKRIERV